MSAFFNGIIDMETMIRSVAKGRQKSSYEFYRKRNLFVGRFFQLSIELGVDTTKLQLKKEIPILP